MGRHHLIAFLSLGIALSATSPIRAADPPAKSAANAPHSDEALSEAQQSLLLQLSDAEANIRALNIALARTGYKVGQAYNRIDSGQKGNELMDRKGGGPVGWQDFYGKTARDFYMPDSETNIHAQGGGRRTVDVHTTQGNHPIQRPSQFDAIYKANADQIARAKEQVAALAQDQATLLARRQKHEADQSRLWAMLSFERITDREIADEPLCRFKLKSATSAADSRVQILRAVVLFLRTADQVAIDSLESVKTDQAAAFGDLDPRMKGAYATLRASLADAMLGSDLKPEDKKQADGLKAVCKQLWDEASIVADNYRNALDRDQAKEDNSKLVFREKLQESLAKFSATTAELDVEVADAGKKWGVTPENGAATTDALPARVARSERPTIDTAKQDAPAAALPVSTNGAWRPLFNGKDFQGWTAANAAGWGGAPVIDWKFDNGCLIGAGNGQAVPGVLFTSGEIRNFHLQFHTMLAEGKPSRLSFRSTNPGANEALAIHIPTERQLDTEPMGSIFLGTLLKARATKTDLRPNEWILVDILAQGHRVEVGINGKMVAQYDGTEMPQRTGHLSFFCARAASFRIKDMQILDLDGSAGVDNKARTGIRR